MSSESLNFIEEIVEEDRRAGRFGGRVHTRFPPEPNGYLHIGHAKSICLNFGIAAKYGGKTNLRFDDTNPTTEELEYVEAIKKDVRWLGFDWGDRLFFASDFMEQLYGFAVKLITDGKAYVCDLTPEQVREYRGTLTQSGKPSPYRSRTPADNLALFERMRKGEFEEGSKTLRAKIDMASPNINLRDPVLYRISKEPHYRLGTKWCIYPTYDFEHGQVDSLEGITHSICTLEFENHRPLYDWILDNLGVHHARQIEFARLELTYTVMSKRKLLELVKEGHVKGWDDPRMPTICGLRRRGVPPEAIRAFCERIGVAKMNSVIDVGVLENAIREDLNRRAARVLAVLRPLKVVLTNWPAGKVEEMEAINNPEDPSAGSRKIPFSRELYIERDDFMEVPPPKFFRLAPGREARLRYGYIIKCEEIVKDPKTGEVTELRCTFDPNRDKKVKATIHWVSAAHAVPAEARLYEHLFVRPDPDHVEPGKDWKSNLNPNSLERVTTCLIEPSAANAPVGSRLQFERLGYFCVDPDSAPGRPVFNRTVTLRDTWAKIEKKEER